MSMLDHFPRELLVGLSGPLGPMPGLGNAFISLRLLQTCLAWAQSSQLTPRVAAAFLSLLRMSGCADVPSDPQERAAFDRANDPAEPTNRAIFEANQFADRNLVRPVATAYKDYVPDRVQRGIHNFVGNLREPQVALNDALQGNLGRAGNTTLRFGVNTPAGVGGVFDVAAGWELSQHQADFGQTLGVWGVGPGPFVELPLLGPSNVRDAVGSAVGVVADPFSSVLGVASLATIGQVRSGLGLLDGRASALDVTDQLEAQSLDYYATLRSVSSQRRANLVAEGNNPASRTTSPPGPDPNPLAPALP
jgi:phospholipid-binding lipoprotein MlaA